MSELEAGTSSPEPTPVESAAVIDTSPPAIQPADTPQARDEAVTQELSDVWDKQQVNGADREADGKFSNGKELSVQPPSETTEPATPAIDPPNSWTAEAKAHWPKLPPEAQQYVLQRESEAHRAITSYGERLKSFEPVDRIITQFKGDWDRRGLTPDQAISILVDAQSRLDANPLDGLVAIARTYGIDLGALLNGQQVQLPAHDPRVGQVEQRLARFEQSIEQQRQQQEQAQLSEVNALIETFKADHPHFDAIEDEMMGLIPVLRQRNPGLSQKDLLAKAYDSAAFANPTTRSRIQEDQRLAAEKARKETEDKAKEAAAAKAEEAKKSARLNVKGSVANPSNKSMDDTLESIARKFYG